MMNKILLSGLAILIFWTLPLSTQAQSLHLYDQVVAVDTEWSGEITIEGVVMVARGVTLTIKPETRILFRKIDRNNDGIGDSEIRVLGRIIANGEPGKTISFASAEKDPQRKDWSYLLIFSSGQENSIRYCTFSHAFSGVQVHFSVAQISDCLFENNHEGLRFGRGELTIEHNLFSSNDIGIRFTRMEGPAVIRLNEITNNRIGVFLVPSGQNITDFFEPDRSGKPWNTGRLTIARNNIHGNLWYDLSLGEKQFWNLEAKDNWWGSIDSREIEAKMFAHNRDEALGNIFFEPAAQEKISGAGIRKQQ